MNAYTASVTSAWKDEMALAKYRNAFRVELHEFEELDNSFLIAMCDESERFYANYASIFFSTRMYCAC